MSRYGDGGSDGLRTLDYMVNKWSWVFELLVGGYWTASAGKWMFYKSLYCKPVTIVFRQCTTHTKSLMHEWQILLEKSKQNYFPRWGGQTRELLQLWPRSDPLPILFVHSSPFQLAAVSQPVSKRHQKYFDATPKQTLTKVCGSCQLGRLFIKL